MNNFQKKDKKSNMTNNINYIDISRYNLENNGESSILNERSLWKNKIELTRDLNFKEQQKITFRKNRNDNNYRYEKLKENCNTCYLKRLKEKESELKNDNKKLEFFNKNILYKIIDQLWNTLSIEKENSIDLFNEKLYSNLTEKEKKKFQNCFLPHFISYAENCSEIKNSFFEKNLNLKNKYDEHINELKRIANENNLCLLINCDKENGLSEDRSMLIVPKNMFFKIIRKIILNENLIDSDSRGNIAFKTLLQISKKKENILNEDQYFILKDPKHDSNSNYCPQKPNDLNKIYYSIKKHFPLKKKNDILLKEDYEIIEKENINDLIHNTIMQLSKNPKTKNVEGVENIKSLLKYKDTNKKKKYVHINKKKEVYSPLGTLKIFLERDNNILDYRDFLDELRSCTFQPNIHKYIEEEKINIKKKTLEIKEKEKEEEIELEKLFKNDNNTVINEEVYKLLCKSINEPYNDIKNMNIMKYLKLFDLYYNANMDKNLDKKTKHYSNPTHRINRHNFRSVNNCNINNIKSKEKKKSEMIVDYKNMWINELRGGYINNYFNFSLNDKEFPLKKQHQIREVDWGEKIRLKGRRMQSKVIPNLDLVNKMIENNSTYVKEEPTTFVVKKKFFPKYDWKNEKSKKQTLIPRQNVSNVNDSLEEEKTYFMIPTPIKSYKYNRLLRIKNELNNFGKLTSFAPPKVIAIKSDKILEDIKKELLSLPESVHFIDKHNSQKKK